MNEYEVLITQTETYKKTVWQAAECIDHALDLVSDVWDEVDITETSPTIENMEKTYEVTGARVIDATSATEPTKPTSPFTPNPLIIDQVARQLGLISYAELAEKLISIAGDVDQVIRATCIMYPIHPENQDADEENWIYPWKLYRTEPQEGDYENLSQMLEHFYDNALCYGTIHTRLFDFAG